MGLIKWGFTTVLRLIGDYYASPHIPLTISHSDDEGPDDLWPDEEYAQVMVGALDNAAITTTRQWGLQLPSGQVHWNSWMNISLTTPLDRVKMIATLQKTALDMGLGEGKQTEEFLQKYKWQTRDQEARIRYKNIESYALTDPEVSAAPKEVSNDGYPQDNSTDHLHSHRDLYTGSMGGDA